MQRAHDLISGASLINKDFGFYLTFWREYLLPFADAIPYEAYFSDNPQMFHEPNKVFNNTE
jgi:hypothetical protein